MPEIPPFLLRLQGIVTGKLTGVGRHVLSFAIGLLMALIMHYLLYRIGLPSKPFIYVAF
jgi:hypothetical protein